MTKYQPQDIQVGWWVAECCVLDLEQVTSQAQRDDIVADLENRWAVDGTDFGFLAWPTPEAVYADLHDDLPDHEWLLRRKLGMEEAPHLAALRAAQQGAEGTTVSCGYAMDGQPWIQVKGDGRLETFGPGDKVRVTKVAPDA